VPVLGEYIEVFSFLTVHPIHLPEVKNDGELGLLSCGGRILLHVVLFSSYSSRSSHMRCCVGWKLLPVEVDRFVFSLLLMSRSYSTESSLL